MSQITHTKRDDGSLRQIVSAEVLREILDASGDDYSRPKDFGPNDEWDVGKMEFLFATDSETGTIEAADFDSACEKLDAMVSGVDGAWGWVDDVDGTRYSIGDC